MISDTSTRKRCHIATPADIITDKPISGPVGAGHSKPDDIRMVQRRAGLLDDHAYIQDERFLFLSKFQRLHNASTLAMFFQEWCVGHANVSSIRFLLNKTHFSKFPRVNGATGEIEVGN